MSPYLTLTEGDYRVVYEYDDFHQTRGSYGYETEAETKAAEDEEIEKLESGEWVVLCATAYRKASCDCPDCSGWHEGDSCGGIVVENDETKITADARWNGWLPEVAP